MVHVPSSRHTEESDITSNDRQSDLSHHFSAEARATIVAPMQSFWNVPSGTFNMGNGNPLHPLCGMSFIVPSVQGPDPVQAWKAGTGEQQTISSHKNVPSSLGIGDAMGYSASAGLKQVRDTLAELNGHLHAPPNHIVTLSLGNADALSKCFRLLGDRGDSFLCDEFTFRRITDAALPLGVNWVPIFMDKDGLVPSNMEQILTNWDEASRGKRPHVLYTVPCAQNPTGSSLPFERRQQIYRIAQDWDIVILEDDPYFFLQHDLDIQQSAVEQHGIIRAVAEALPRSFLSMDCDGRVIRMDSFSKIIAPGMRLGWITTSESIAKKLSMLIDYSTQQPHGFGQLFVSELLGNRGWGIEGLMKWVSCLAREYGRRRNLFMDVFNREVAVTGLASVDAPTSGMFAWIKVHLHCHPRYRTLEDAMPGEPTSNTVELMDELFRKFVECGLLVIPASIFAINDGPGHVFSGGHIADRMNYFRAAFSGSDETIESGMVAFGRGIKEFFGC